MGIYPANQCAEEVKNKHATAMAYLTQRYPSGVRRTRIGRETVESAGPEYDEVQKERWISGLGIACEIPRAGRGWAGDNLRRFRGI